MQRLVIVKPPICFSKKENVTSVLVRVFVIHIYQNTTALATGPTGCTHAVGGNLEQS